VSDAVRKMFAGLSRRYDLANTLLSLGLHKYWRPKLLNAGRIPRGGHVLDCACGTGDVALLALRRVGPTGKVVGCDFAEEMLQVARCKAERLQDGWLDAPGTAQLLREAIRFDLADALNLPYADHCFNAATVAFGVRNFDDPVRGLAELARVVNPGGSVLVLETGLPANPLVRTLYKQYCAYHLPTLGALVTGDRAAYEYLHRTVWTFPHGDAFVALMLSSGGYERVAAEPLAGGLAWIYHGIVSSS
jgi:demethylmenaquinone methyltransferase/2-methoxy-6-polyprenyl-1,4-benzoquinol methylase